MTDELCAACGHAERHHDPEDRNCEQHADRGMGRCRCNCFIRHDNPAIENAVAAAVAEERAAVVAWLREVADAPETYIDEGIALRDASAAIENGEHRREEKP